MFLTILQSFLNCSCTTFLQASLFFAIAYMILEFFRGRRAPNPAEMSFLWKKESHTLVPLRLQREFQFMTSCSSVRFSNIFFFSSCSKFSFSPAFLSSRIFIFTFGVQRSFYSTHTNIFDISLYFLQYKQKKVLVSCKFSISGF